MMLEGMVCILQGQSKRSNFAVPSMSASYSFVTDDEDVR